MCGIVGYIGTQIASEILLAGLEKLEYRGYDSAGLAMVSDNQVHSIRAKGKLYNLREKLAHTDISANMGIGHTRWATHGVPNDENSHPHLSNSGNLAIIHNGIIENFKELRAELATDGITPNTETDTDTRRLSGLT